MSFLDVLDSIGTGQRAAAPQAQQSTSSSKLPHPLPNPTTAKLNAAVSRPALDEAFTVPNGTKRTVNEAYKAAERLSQPSQKQASSSGIQDRKAAVNVSSQAAPRSSPVRAGIPTSSATTAKVPRPGSFAALMAEAKAAQKQRAKSEVGLIKHQATSKIRLSKSERRKQEEGDKAMRAKLGKQPQTNSKVEKRAPLDPKKRSEYSYLGTAKSAPPISSYKGTAGRPSQHRPSSADARQKAGKTPRRYDEYLGTDEEDEGDDIEAVDMDNGYGSDASSDMEADAFDVEEEETKALREARADDARELARENKLKREKEQRRRKLEALAQKRR